MMTTKTCKACAHCKRLYVKGYYGYFMCKLYYCALREEPTEPSGACENRTPKKTEYDVGAARFDGAERDIALIAAYLNDFP